MIPNKIHHTKYLQFWLTVEGLKTNVYRVVSHKGADLGEILWFQGWKQYTFCPEPATEYNNTCLRDIANFLDRVNAEHKNKTINTPNA